MARATGGHVRGRARRYAQVTAAATGIGARLAVGAVRRGTAPDDADKAVLLRRALGGLKGPLMKVAQFLGSIPDLVPDVYARELAQLQADAPSMGPSFVRRRMAGELGPDWQGRFDHFDLDASFAASLGQVHRARGRDGADLACKLQYPDMGSVVAADLRQLKILLAVFEHYDRAVGTSEVQQEIADRLYEELDYAREAKAMQLYGAMLADTAGVHVPKPVAALSTDRLLTMDWMDGARFIDVAQSGSQAQRDAIATHMFHAWYVPFYHYAIIHGDPHMGNYTVRDDGSVNLLDFGCIRVFDPTLVQGVMMLYRSFVDDRPDDAVEAYRLWGFENPSRDLIAILNIWARFIYAPLLEDKKRPVAETNTGVYGRETARRIHRALRDIGGVTVPRAFVFMDRAAVGLGGVFLRLGASLNWYRMFHDVAGAFDVADVARRQKNLVKKINLLDLHPPEHGK